MNIVLDVSEFQSVAQLDQMLRNADDLVVGVYIKATQGLSYRDPLAASFAMVCQHHNTPFGFYDYMTNDAVSDQVEYYKSFLDGQPLARLIPMLDCEGAYDKGALGVAHWKAAWGGPVVVYASLANMPDYDQLTLPKWVAQYDSTSYYRPSTAELNNYRTKGYTLWQWTSNYMGLNQDASVLLGSLDTLKGMK